MRDLLLHIRFCRLTKDKVPDSLKSNTNLLKSNIDQLMSFTNQPMSNINQLKSSIETLKSNTDQLMSNTDAQKSTIDSPMSNTRAHMIKAILINCACSSASDQCGLFPPFGDCLVVPFGYAPFGVRPRSVAGAPSRTNQVYDTPSGVRPVGAHWPIVDSPLVSPSGSRVPYCTRVLAALRRTSSFFERQGSLALADKPSLLKSLLAGARWTSKSCEANPAGDSLWGTTLGRVDNPELWHSLTSAINAVTPVATDWSLVTSALGGNNPVLVEYSVLTSARY